MLVPVLRPMLPQQAHLAATVGNTLVLIISTTYDGSRHSCAHLILPRTRAATRRRRRTNVERPTLLSGVGH
jgi:hypothetical protein